MKKKKIEENNSQPFMLNTNKKKEMAASSLLYTRIIISLVYLNSEYRKNKRGSLLNPDAIVVSDQRHSGGGM